MKERIVLAAIKHGDTVVTGDDHMACVLQLPEENLQECVDGFWTSLNRFVEREEAYAIAEAAEQVDKEHQDFDYWRTQPQWTETPWLNAEYLKFVGESK